MARRLSASADSVDVRAVSPFGDDLESTFSLDGVHGPPTEPSPRTCVFVSRDREDELIKRDNVRGAPDP